MSLFSKLFGSKGKPGFQSTHTKEADDALWNRYSGALGNISNPTEYKMGSSPFGFNDPNLKPYQFTMPKALDQEKGFFSEMMNNTQRGLLRNQKGAVDQSLRNAQLTGNYSPAMASEVTDDALRKTNEQYGDFATQGALGLAKERAGYESGMQQNQAAENRATRQQALEGEKFGLEADQAQKNYFLNLLQSMFKSFIDPYAGQKGATPGSKGIIPSILDTAGSVASTVGMFM